MYALAPQAPAQRDGVVQAERVQVDVDAVVGVERTGGARVRARPVHLQQRASAGQAHVAVLLVAEARERAEQPLGRGARRDQVEVAVLAPARAPDRRTGRGRRDRRRDGRRRRRRAPRRRGRAPRRASGAAPGAAPSGGGPSMPSWYRDAAAAAYTCDSRATRRDRRPRPAVVAVAVAVPVRQGEVRLAADHVPEPVLAPLPLLVEALVAARGALHLARGCRAYRQRAHGDPGLARRSAPDERHRRHEDARRCRRRACP